MRKKPHPDLSRVDEIDRGMPWTRHSIELISSYAWKSMKINCRKLMDFLEIEHMNHAGRENGFLIATYDQLEKYGMTRRCIKESIQEAEKLGLIRVEWGTRKGYCKSHYNTFRLTYLTYKNIEDDGRVLYYPPTNDWRHVKEA